MTTTWPIPPRRSPHLLPRRPHLGLSRNRRRCDQCRAGPRPGGDGCDRCTCAGRCCTIRAGILATEENKGNVRVEQCGANLCGYSVKSNEKILINMKPDGAKWTGRIHDPDSGRNYDSTIAMKGPNAMRVQGCAFGGMFCGGQTWKRVS